MNVEDVTLAILEEKQLQSTEDFDLLELERLCQPHYDRLAQIIWAYTIAHSKPATEE